MGSGGKFREDNIPVGMITTAYAAIGNLKDAVAKTEELIDSLGTDPNNAETWKGLEAYSDRLKSRGVTLVTVIRTLLKSQGKAK